MRKEEARKNFLFFEECKPLINFIYTVLVLTWCRKNTSATHF